jgi:hypothetical protein
MKRLAGIAGLIHACCWYHRAGQNRPPLRLAILKTGKDPRENVCD